MHCVISPYPFGMLMGERTFSSEKYRLGFQGQEKDDEVSGKNNSYSFKYRMHDSRLGRFLSIDPLTSKFAWNSPYAFAENKVLEYIEFEGLETVPKDQIWNLNKVSSPIVQFETDRWIVARIEGNGSTLHKITSGDNEGNYLVRQYVGTSTDGHRMIKDAFIVGANRISEFANKAIVPSVDEGTPGVDVWNEYRALLAGNALGANKYGSLENFEYTSYWIDQWTDPEKLIGLINVGSIGKPKPSGLGNPFKGKSIGQIERSMNNHVKSDKLEMKYTDPISGSTVILPKIWTRGLVKKSLNLTKQYDKTNTPQVFA